MSYFRGMDGMRGWMALAVIFAHIIQLTGASTAFPPLKIFSYMGDFAVNVFIMISGFVITNLILLKKEDYKTYITRRFFRIYPVYFFCLLIAIVTSQYYAEATLTLPADSISPSIDRLRASMDSLSGDGYMYHIIAHLTLLHGMIPNDILYDSQYMFLAPAWSLSLEWQFYLLAPFIIALIQRPNGPMIASCLTLFLFIMYHLDGFGNFRLHSILPGAGIFFAVGIGARFFIEKLPRLNTYPIPLMIILLGCCAYGLHTLPFFIFALLIIYILVDQPKDKIGGFVEYIATRLLDSKMAHYLGKLAYPIYLIHMPVLQIFIYGIHSYTDIAFMEMMIILCFAVPAVTVICAAFIHKYIELPFINLKKQKKIRLANLRLAFVEAK